MAEVCSCPLIPSNGLISGCNDTDIVGDTVEYSCRSGYYLVGSSTRTCQTGGNWTGSAPNCEPGIVEIHNIEFHNFIVLQYSPRNLLYLSFCSNQWITEL